jgi:broad-specificity NMP kinase
MARKRIALSVRPEYHEKLIKLAEYQNRTITTVVNELLNECEIAVDLMLGAYEQIEKGVDQKKVLENMLADGLGIVNGKLNED